MRTVKSESSSNMGNQVFNLISHLWRFEKTSGLITRSSSSEQPSDLPNLSVENSTKKPGSTFVLHFLSKYQNKPFSELSNGWFSRSYSVSFLKIEIVVAPRARKTRTNAALRNGFLKKQRLRSFPKLSALWLLGRVPRKFGSRLDIRLSFSSTFCVVSAIF